MVDGFKDLMRVTNDPALTELQHLVGGDTWTVSIKQYEYTRLKASRLITTLFILMSVDGKINTGSSDELDVDRDSPTVTGVAEDLYQYYKIEQSTDLWSFNIGRMQAKMSVNEKPFSAKTPVPLALLDNHHLMENGVKYFCALSKQAMVITSNPNHPAFSVKEDNPYITFQGQVSLKAALEYLHKDRGCARLTMQSGGIVSGLFLREKLFDFVDTVVAPILIDGKDTPTLIDGQSLKSKAELSDLGVLKLIECSALEDSHIRLRYQVIG